MGKLNISKYDVPGAKYFRSKLEWIGHHPDCPKVHRGSKKRTLLLGMHNCPVNVEKILSGLQKD